MIDILLALFIGLIFGTVLMCLMDISSDCDEREMEAKNNEDNRPIE